MYEKTVKINPLWHEKKRITTLEGLLRLIKKSDPPIFVKGLDSVHRRFNLMQQCDKQLIRIRIGRSMETDIIKHAAAHTIRHSVEILGVYESVDDKDCIKCKSKMFHNLITNSVECCMCCNLQSTDLTPVT